MPTGTDRQPYLSAASGLVQIADLLYVVADDELHLGVFSCLGEHAPGELVRLFDGKLPNSPAKRKKRKPDLEALVRLPAFGPYPHGGLLALGSGSKQTRHRGALLPLTASGTVIADPQLIELQDFHQRLVREFDDLNIEGAAINDDALVLFQRGNKGASDNACVSYDLRDVLESLADRKQIEGLRPRNIRYYELGEIEGVPLCFTDAASLWSGEIVFTAVAENTEDSCHDGACVGAAVGVLDSEGRVSRIEQLATAHKLEGIHAWSTPNGIEFLSVTDPDNPAIPGQVYHGRLPH
ncbi:MAG: hypothetical protein EXR86_11320 [Gammaproteobacteria bacterium]|nr:hypothetical protein [Gammaproteobacteria bacterium]